MLKLQPVPADCPIGPVARWALEAARLRMVRHVESGFVPAERLSAVCEDLRAQWSEVLSFAQDAPPTFLVIDAARRLMPVRDGAP